MRKRIYTRPEEFAYYLLEEKCTIRKVAAAFNISKSTVHNDLSKKLKYIDYELYLRVQKLLDSNFKERHIRGGNATKIKYLQQKKYR